MFDPEPMEIDEGVIEAELEVIEAFASYRAEAMAFDPQ